MKTPTFIYQSCAIIDRNHEKFKDLENFIPLWGTFSFEAEQNDAFDNSEATDAVVVLVKTTERIYVCHAKLATFSSPQATNGLRLQR